MKKVVVMGGGNGSAIILNALKKHVDDFDITAVIATSDSGGSSGQLRKEFKCLPSGDILRAILALSPYNYLLLKQIFYGNRFQDLGRFTGHNLGNLFLTLGAEYDKNFLHSIKALSAAVESVGKVIPNSLKPTELVAELNNGKKIVGESRIDRPDYSRQLFIKKVYLKSEIKMYQGAQKAIEEADYIIFGPGSLYTSVIAAILPDGARQAIKKSKAKLIFIAGGAYEINGETGPASISETILTLESYLPKKLDLVVYNQHKHTKERTQNYQSRNWDYLEFDKNNLKERKMLCFDFERTSGGLCPDKLADNIKKIL